MNSLNHSIKRACLIFAALFFISVPIVWISLFFTNHHGDLTRVGEWREADFAWQIEQPEIPQEWLKNDPINEADVLVIGDSFSISLHWQSVLKKEGLKVATLAWSQISHLCADFPEQLVSIGFKGEFIVIESVERLLSTEVSKSLNCVKGKKLQQITQKEALQTPTKINLNESFNINGQFIAGAKTIFNSIAIRVVPNYPSYYNLNSSSKDATILRINNGCNFFSHNLCTYGLFYNGDYKNPPPNKEAFDGILLLQQRLQATNKKIIWAIVPNKSSIYTNKGNGKFWDEIEKHRLGPNLYKTIQSKKHLEKDLYAPNDTHLSNKGYILLGNEIHKYLRP
jgi:hypothetical protein